MILLLAQSARGLQLAVLWSFAPRLKVEKVEALEQERCNFEVLCLNLPVSLTVDGVLGLDFFRGLPLIIDLRRGVLVVDAGT